jgi:hypothetical protein
LNQTYNWDALHGEEGKNDEMPPLALAVPIDQEGSDSSASSGSDEEEGQGKVIKRYRLQHCEKTIDRLEGIHIPTVLPNTKRRKCVFHRQAKTRYFCETCDVGLCLSDNAKESCWFKFHHVETWKEK